MDAFQQLQADFHAGRVSPAQIFSFLSDSLRQLHETQAQLQDTQARLQETQQQLKSAENRIEELEKKTRRPADTPNRPTLFSAAEEKRQQAKDGKNKEQGQRRADASIRDKMDLVARTEPIYPEGVPPEQCKLSHVRPVWRLEKGRAVLVAYEIYRGPNNQYGKIPGVLGRSEFGLEIVMAIAYLVYVMGLSLRQSLPAARLLPESAAAQVASRRVAAAVVASIGKANSTCCARCWRTRRWCMPTRRVGA